MNWVLRSCLLVIVIIAALWLKSDFDYIRDWLFSLSKVSLGVTSDSVLVTKRGADRDDDDALFPPRISIAFVGNSMMYVNDLPRFMQELAGKSSPQGEYLIQQNSCLHGALNFRTLLEKGNGMLQKWNTDNAYIGNGIYDFGMCTVRQLLLGYDEGLSWMNSNGNYTNDGKNPCFTKSSAYFDYLIATAEIPKWDFVLLNDQTTFPAIEAKKKQSLQVLQQEYVPMLGDAIPVLYATHGYQSSVVNVTNMGNVSEFTSLVFEGYRQYAQMLDENLPQKPRIAPVGLAFLVVYEENRNMWKKLFFVDGLHPSPHGSYLMGCVLYATLYGHLPKHWQINPDALWKRARRMQSRTEYVMPYPTFDEALYLYQVAQKVMIFDHRPNTWIRYFKDSESDYIGKGH